MRSLKSEGVLPSPAPNRGAASPVSLGSTGPKPERQGLLRVWRACFARPALRGAPGFGEAGPTRVLGNPGFPQLVDDGFFEVRGAHARKLGAVQIEGRGA